MVEQLSPLAPVLRAGRFSNTAAEIGVTLTETAPGSIVQVAMWPGGEQAGLDAIKTITGLTLGLQAGAGDIASKVSGFGIGPGRFLLIAEDEGLTVDLTKALPSMIGAVTDLSHGRTALRIDGPASRWVLSKLFAIDFGERAFVLGSGISTKHHEIFAQIQRTGPDAFEIFVFRSFARSFWHSLTRAADEVGYEVR